MLVCVSSRERYRPRVSISDLQPSAVGRAAAGIDHRLLMASMAGRVRKAGNVFEFVPRLFQTMSAANGFR